MKLISSEDTSTTERKKKHELSNNVVLYNQYNGVFHDKNVVNWKKIVVNKEIKKNVRKMRKKRAFRSAMVSVDFVH